MANNSELIDYLIAYGYTYEQSINIVKPLILQGSKEETLLKHAKENNLFL